MSPEPLEETYFKWLAFQVVSPRRRSINHEYWMLLRQLFGFPFVWHVRNDDNRAEDGVELRQVFLSDNPELTPSSAWLRQDCSFLELLLALANRLSFQTEGVSVHDWFWQLIANCELMFSDGDYREPSVELFVQERLISINNRTYSPTGHGGLFPLNNPQIDQTQIEIWSQMNNYLIERSI